MQIASIDCMYAFIIYDNVELHILTYKQLHLLFWNLLSSSRICCDYAIFHGNNYMSTPSFIYFIFFEVIVESHELLCSLRPVSPMVTFAKL